MWINAIFDRTQVDVDLIKLDPTNQNTKGVYNYTDLNRIENNCKYVMDILNASEVFDVSVEITTKLDWAVKDIPHINDFNRIRNNIKLLIETFTSKYNLNSYEEIEFTNTMNYIKANILEKDLDIIKIIIESSEKELRRCNSFYCGADGLGLFAKPIEFITVKKYSGLIRCGEELRL